MQVKLTTRGIELEFDSSWGTGALVCPLVGDFNVDNLLTVIAVLLDWDIALEQVIDRENRLAIRTLAIIGLGDLRRIER